VARSSADAESVLRLAAGLWAEGDRIGARQVLEAARAQNPDEPVYVATLGVVAESVGEYEAARDLYAAFIDGTRASALSFVLTERLRVTRGETAPEVAASVVASGGPLDHRLGSEFVVAVVPFEAAESDPELAALALAATELLASDLESREPFRVIPWEITDLTERAVNPGESPLFDAQTLTSLLGAQQVVWGEVRRAPGDSLVLRINASWTEAGGTTPIFGGDEIRVGLETFSEDRSALTERTFELLIGGERGSLESDYFGSPSTASTSALVAFGEGLSGLLAGDRPGALASLQQAQVLAPEFPPLRARIAQLEALDAFETSRTLPLAEDILGLARRLAATDALTRDGFGDVSPTRHGIGEALGLDRLGSQGFIDIVIQLGTAP
jgi:TolB-like protein